MNWNHVSDRQHLYYLYTGTHLKIQLSRNNTIWTLLTGFSSLSGALCCTSWWTGSPPAPRLSWPWTESRSSRPRRRRARSCWRPPGCRRWSWPLSSHTTKTVWSGTNEFKKKAYLVPHYKNILNEEVFKIAFKEFFIFFNQGVGLLSGGFCLGVIFHLGRICYQHGFPV